VEGENVSAKTLDRTDRLSIASMLSDAIDQGWSTFPVQPGGARENEPERAKAFWLDGGEMDIDPAD